MARQPERRKNGEPSWLWRRVMLYAVLIWACYQLFILINAPDTRVNETIAWGWQLIIMVLVFGYTGFATMQDVVAIYTTRAARPYADPPVEPTPAPDQTITVQAVATPQQQGTGE
ncbi:hypothetical protein NKH82_17960 [Mesorhizobium sp. M0915]|uniref:hypothetical protein n=1 Tax=Mesorhizobium sp. M0915 TaxID=2957027 RepID=UPI00333B22E5